MDENDVKTFISKFKRSRLKHVKDVKSAMANRALTLQEKTHAYVKSQKLHDEKFKSDIKVAQKHLDSMKDGKTTLEQVYKSLRQKYFDLFKDMEKKMEKILKKQAIKSQKIVKSNEFLETFQPQVQRLLLPST